MRLEQFFMWGFPVLSVGMEFWWLSPVLREGAGGGFWLRCWVGTVVGLAACLFRMLGSIDYGDSRNSGLLATWLVGMLMGAFSLGLGSAVILLGSR